MNRPNMNRNKFKINEQRFDENNLYKRFKKQFETLLAFDYNEGTVRGRYYYQVDDKMKNLSYVPQKELENELLEFKDSVINNTKILV